MAGRFPDEVYRAQVGTTVYPGAKLYIYENGTTTKVGVGVALDARNGSDVANPLIMDANGEANLWLKPGAQYTLKLDDADDVQLRSKDGISANDLESWTTSGSDISYSAGNVGIGGAAGSETLLVTGSCKITSTLEVDGHTSLDGSTSISGSIIGATIDYGLIVNNNGTSANDTIIRGATEDYMVYVNSDSSSDFVSFGGNPTGVITGSYMYVSSTSVGVQVPSTFTDDVTVNANLEVNGDLELSGLSRKITIDGSLGNDFIGSTTLNGTTGVTVANTNITASDRIQFSRSGTSASFGHIYATISAGVSFTIFSSDASDNGTVSYTIFREG